MRISLFLLSRGRRQNEDETKAGQNGAKATRHTWLKRWDFAEVKRAESEAG